MLNTINLKFWNFLAGSVQENKLNNASLMLKLLIYGLGILTIYPVLMSSLDLWDGVIIDYAFSEDIPEIYKTWFLESGWPIVEYLYLAIHYSAESIRVDGPLLTNIIMFVALFLSGREIYFLCERCFGVPALPALIGVLLYYFNPALPVNLSSVFLMHAVFIYLCLLGVRLYLSGSSKQSIFGLFLVFISFQHNANPTLFLFILICSHLFSERKQPIKDLAVLTILAVAFIIFRKIFPAHGLYTNYNTLNLFNLANFGLWGKYTPLYNLLFSALGFSIIVIFAQKPEKMYRVFIAALAIVFTILPYILVGKFPNISDLHSPNGWSMRFASNLFVAVSLFIPILLYHSLKNANRLGVLIVAISIVLTFYSYSNSLISSYAAKSKALLYQELFVSEISEFEDLKPGNIYISHDSHRPSFYETNYYFYRAFGSASWMALQNESVTDLGVTYNLKKYKDKYILSDYVRICDTRFKVNDNLDLVPNRSLIFYLYSGLKPSHGFPSLMSIEKEIIRCL